MLPIPDPLLNRATIVGLDPGTEMLGFGVLTINVDTFEILSSDAVSYKGSKLIGSDWSEQIFGARYRRIQAHRNNLISLFKAYQPLIIACESPFILMRRPQAYGALTEVVCGIRSAVEEYDAWRPLYMIPPSSVKNAVGCKGNGDKAAMKIAMGKLTEVVEVLETPLSRLDEHAIDSLAVAYSAYKSLRENGLESLYI
jgi:Holliday junction resolvasome RuvABC endonuclease subunit